MPLEQQELALELLEQEQQELELLELELLEQGRLRSALPLGQRQGRQGHWRLLARLLLLSPLALARSSY